MPNTLSSKQLSLSVYVQALVVPAVLSVALAAVILGASAWAGAIFGIATASQVLTSSVLGLLLIRARARLPLEDRPLAQLEATWLVSWVLGIVSFAVISYLLSLYQQAHQIAASEGFVLSPIYWVLSIPTLAIYLLSSFFLFKVSARSA